MVTDFKTSGKNSDLFDILYKHFGKTINKARIRFMAAMVCALCKMQTVSFGKLALAFGGKADTDSAVRRIQRFMANYALDLPAIARLIFRLLPHEGPYTLPMDRTAWDFGGFTVNALVLGVTYEGVAFPLPFRLLPKKGNSNTAERIAIIGRYIALFGRNSIDCLVADREFVGADWLTYLNLRCIRYQLRIRENFRVANPRTGSRFKASWGFTGLRVGQSMCLRGIHCVNGQLCYLSAARMKDEDGIPQLQILVSFNRPEEAVETYRKRWQIETCFKSMKSSGFNIEDTHLADIERIERLFAIVTIAFLWAYLAGIHKNMEVKPIRMLNNGRKAVSIFKYGLDYIADCLLNPSRIPKFDVFQILSCT